PADGAAIDGECRTGDGRHGDAAALAPGVVTADEAVDHDARTGAREAAAFHLRRVAAEHRANDRHGTKVAQTTAVAGRVAGHRAVGERKNGAGVVCDAAAAGTTRRIVDDGARAQRERARVEDAATPAIAEPVPHRETRYVYRRPPEETDDVKHPVQMSSVNDCAACAGAG